MCEIFYCCEIFFFIVVRILFIVLRFFFVVVRTLFIVLRFFLVVRIFFYSREIVEVPQVGPCIYRKKNYIKSIPGWSMYL